jgi:hypothetical protein
MSAARENGAVSIVVPDCSEPDRYHEPPGTRPAVYWYEYRDRESGLSGPCMVLCVECCARRRMLADPAPTRIWMIRDANTLEPVI